MTRWVQFVSQYGAELRIPTDKVLGLSASGNDWECKVIGMEYTGPITFIYMGDHGGEDGSGWTVRGRIDEVQAKLDGTYREEEPA
jgi:hypothetical protein